MGPRAERHDNLRNRNWQRVFVVHGELKRERSSNSLRHHARRYRRLAVHHAGDLIQLGTGLALLYVTGYALSDRWVFWGLVLYFFAGACWIPVLWMQIRMRDLAAKAVAQETSLPDAYWVFDKWWIVAGSLAFPAVIVIFYLMVAKP